MKNHLTLRSSLIVAVFLFAGINISHAQLYNRIWEKTYGNDSVPGTYLMKQLCTDHQGHVYVLSSKDSTNYSEVVELRKYSSGGQMLWEKYYVSPYGEAYGITLSCDAHDNILIGGYESSISQLYDYLVLKYDSSGNLLWKFNDNGIANGNDLLDVMKIDNLDNIYITGRAELTRDPVYNTDVLTCKLNSGGNLLWHKYLNYPNDSNVYSYPQHLNLDKQNNLIITGTFETGEIFKMDSAGNILWVGTHPSTFGAYINGVTVDNSGASYLTGSSMILVKYDSSGNFIWQKSLLPSLNSASFSIEHRNNSLFITGYNDVTTLTKCVTLKIDLNGDTLWASFYNSGPGINNYGRKIICHGDGNITIAGNTQTSASNYDLLVLRLDSSGNLLWHQNYDDSLNHNDFFVDVACDSSEAVYAATNVTIANQSYGVVNINSSGNLGWIQLRENFQYGRDEGREIVRDNSGNIIVAGRSFSRNNTNDVLILKYNPLGNLLWRRRIDSTLRDSYPSQIVVDADNSIYIGGSTGGGVNITEMVIVKLDSSGNIIFNNRYSGPAGLHDEATAIATDNDKNCYVFGMSKNVSGIFDVILLKYNSSGNLLWLKTVADTASNHGRECLINAGHNILYCAYTNQDIGIAKIDTAGNILWKRYYDSPSGGFDAEVKLSLDLNENILIAGVSDSISLNTIVLKYDSSGNYIWANRYTGIGNENTGATDLDLDESGNAYVTGHETINSSRNFVVERVNSDGSTEWVREITSPAAFPSSEGYGIATSEGNVFATGTYYDVNQKMNLLTVVYDSLGNELYIDTLPSLGPENENTGYDITTDNQGCFYVAGLASLSLSMNDILTLKYCASTLGNTDLAGVRNELTAFPNPASNNFSLSFTSDINCHAEIEAYDMHGIKIMTKKIFLKNGKNVFSINDHLMSGSYLFTLKINNQVIAKSRLIMLE